MNNFVPKDPFQELRSQSMKRGAIAGFIGELIGLSVGFPLFLILSNSLGSDSIIYLGIALFTFLCFPIPAFLIGVAAGGLLGRLSIKRDDETKDSIVFSNVWFRSGVTGFAFGLLPFVILEIGNYLAYGHL